MLSSDREPNLLCVAITGGQDSVHVKQNSIELATRHTSTSGVVPRLPVIRGLGLIAEFLKPAKHQLCPSPSNRLFDKLAPMSLVRQWAV